VLLGLNSSRDAAFVATATGVDLRDPQDLREIKEAVVQYSILHFPNQPIDDAALFSLANSLGEPEATAILPPAGSEPKAGETSAAADHDWSHYLFDVSNMDRNDVIMERTDPRRKIFDGSQVWHTDNTYREWAASYSILLARVLPSRGGDTEFADMAAAYEALDPTTKARIEPLIGVHSVIYSAAKSGYTEWTEEQRSKLVSRARPLVRINPSSGRKSLLLASHLKQIEGWSYSESRALIDELTAFATQPCFVYRHRWALGDLVLWDNRRTMHRVTSFASDREPRRLRSVRLIDDAPARVAADGPC
jgi:alpha-ketoglutarate-dependent 2,4-dichlorophenoxyacetate dioxygenase